jgi:hypothetical protein
MNYVKLKKKKQLEYRLCVYLILSSQPTCFAVQVADNNYFNGTMYEETDLGISCLIALYIHGQ